MRVLLGKFELSLRCLETIAQADAHPGHLDRLAGVSHRGPRLPPGHRSFRRRSSGPGGGRDAAARRVPRVGGRPGRGAPGAEPQP
ncbi:hypothetical protein BG28_14050 [Nesterenkonia sp. AN1]|nr:hypothetical protein BG28_14050 [Nesterenkonia sp. AN1]